MIALTESRELGNNGEPETFLGFLMRHISRLLMSLTLVVGPAFVSLPISAAHADLKVCNDNQALIGVSVGYRLETGWITEGWWRIPPKGCANVITGDLNSRYFYLNAEDAENNGRWQGNVFMCTSSKEFKIEGLENCFARGFERSVFFEVDTGNQKNWLVRITEQNKKISETK